MSKPKFKISKFNPALLEERRLRGNPPTIAIIGKRGSGKSTLISDLLYYMRDIPMFLCMSGTEEGNNFYKRYMHPLCVHGEYKKNIVSNLISQQKKKLHTCNKEGIDPNTRPDLGIGLLLDDCGYDTGILRDKDLRMIFMNGRHWKICFMVSLQYMMGLGPDLRTNIDYVFCLSDNIKNNQEKLYKYFFGCFQKFSHFQETFIECTKNYECLVLDNTSKSNRIQDMIFWYKAKPDRDYRIGSIRLWEYLDNRYNQNFEEEEKEHQRSSEITINKDPHVRKIVKKID